MGLNRRSTVERLAAQGDLKGLVGALGCPQAAVRDAAVTALGDLGDARAVGPLIAMLRDEASYVRLDAVEALGKLGDARAIGPLEAVLADEYEEICRQADAAIRQLHLAAALQRAALESTAQQAAAPPASVPRAAGGPASGDVRREQDANEPAPARTWFDEFAVAPAPGSGDGPVSAVAPAGADLDGLAQSDARRALDDLSSADDPGTADEPAPSAGLPTPPAGDVREVEPRERVRLARRSSRRRPNRRPRGSFKGQRGFQPDLGLSWDAEPGSAAARDAAAEGARVRSADDAGLLLSWD